MSLFRDVEPGDQIQLADATITIEEKTGNRTRLKIDADKARYPITFIKNPITDTRRKSALNQLRNTQHVDNSSRSK